MNLTKQLLLLLLLLLSTELIILVVLCHSPRVGNLQLHLSLAATHANVVKSVLSYFGVHCFLLVLLWPLSYWLCHFNQWLRSLVKYHALPSFIIVAKEPKSLSDNITMTAALTLPPLGKNQILRQRLQHESVS